MAGPIDPRLLRRGRATSTFLAALAVVGVASSALVIAQARLISTHVAHVFATHRTDGVAAGAGLLLLVFCARAVLAWLNEVLAHRASAQVKSTLRHDIMAARLARPNNPGLSSGALLRLVTTGLDDLDGYYSKYLPQLVLAMVVPLIVGVTIALHDLTSAIIIAVTIPLIPVFMALIGLATRDQVNRRLTVSTRLANHFADLVTGLATLQVFSRARNQVIGLRKTEESHRRETMATLRITFMSSFALELLSTISVALVAVTVGLRVLYGHMDLRNALFVLVLAPEAYLPVRQVGVHYHDAADGVAAAEAALDVIDDAEQHAARGQQPLPADTTLTFDDVSFRHTDATTDALAHLSLEVRPGEIVALAGPSGGGKSTALAIAAGLLSPTSGRALVGGVPVRELDQAEWHRAIAWVGQSPGMLRDTIGANAALGSAAPTDADHTPTDIPATDISAALRDAGAGEMDPNWLVGDDAEGLSGGERRRIGVARALLRLRRTPVRLLLLDEPTAGLDSDTEAIVLRAVRDAGVTALVVSHRPAVLAAVDRVVELAPQEAVHE